MVVKDGELMCRAGGPKPVCGVRSPKAVVTRRQEETGSAAGRLAGGRIVPRGDGGAGPSSGNT